MSKKKYFFFDYDGTLAIPHTKEIPESTRNALEALRASGHFVALATGRMQCNAVDYIESAGIDNIVADGGYSVTVAGQLKWMKALDLEPAKECLRRLEAAHIPWAVQLDNELVRYSAYEDFDRFTPDYYVPTIQDPDLDIESLTQILKIYIPCAPQDMDRIVGAGLLDGVPWAHYDSDNIFIEPLNKELGIKSMMDIFGAPYEDVVVFGDGKNDLSMFIPEWTSIAMGNALPALKEKATYVTTACDDDGIYNACKHFGWI